MEKYIKIIEELRSIDGLEKAFNAKYDDYTDSVLLTFYDIETFEKLDNYKSILWYNFDYTCYLNDVNYEVKSYGEIELYF